MQSRERPSAGHLLSKQISYKYLSSASVTLSSKTPVTMCDVTLPRGLSHHERENNRIPAERGSNDIKERRVEETS